MGDSGNLANTQKPADAASRKRGSPGRRGRILALVVLVGVIAFLIGYFVARGRPAQTPAISAGEPKVSGEKRIRYWTCSMHPQINLPQKGKCPICFMDLVPVYESVSGSETGGERLILSKRARELAEIETSPVEYRPLSVTVRVVGKIDYNEMHWLTSLPGWRAELINCLSTMSECK